MIVSDHILMWSTAQWVNDLNKNTLTQLKCGRECCLFYEGASKGRKTQVQEIYLLFRK